MVGKRISLYIKDKQIEYASNEFDKVKDRKKLLKKENYKNVSNFKEKYELKGKGKTMKKYMITDMYNIENEDLTWMTNLEVNEDIVCVEASTKNEVIRKYLNARCEFGNEGVLKNMFFRYFCVSVGYE